MRKFLVYSLLLMLFTAFQCDDEPLEGEFVTDDGTNTEACNDAATAVAEALLDFLVATDDNYTELCNAYREALEAALVTCGDEDGSLQQAIDDLGDCSNENSECAQAQAASDQAEEALNNATNENYTQLCEAYINALFDQIFVCLDPNNELQDIIDGLGDCSPPDQGFNCNGLQLSDAIGNNFECNYDTYESLVVNNVYLQENFVLTDEDNDGNDDHSLIRIFLTDGTAELNANNEFISFTSPATYVLELVLFSLGTNGLAADNYMSFALSNPATESYFSVVGTNLSTGACDVNVFGCPEVEFTILEGILSISGAPGSYEVCFDMVTNNNNACIQGVYNNFIPIVTP